MSRKLTELQALERELAYSVARADIESYCNSVQHSGQHFGRWYDVRENGVHDDFVTKAVRYLELRRLLKRHPENQNLVRILDDPLHS